jgi:hypothetical protein
MAASLAWVFEALERVNLRVWLLRRVAMVLLLMSGNVLKFGCLWCQLQQNAAYTDHEVAFLLGFANYCKVYGENYMKSAAAKLEETSGRKVTWDAVRVKVKTVIRQFGSRGLVVQTFIAEGTECLHVNKPQDTHKRKAC